MTTKLRTGLLLGFTAMLAMATLSGCIIETTSNGPGGSCADQRYFEVSWSVSAGPDSSPYTCDQTPAFYEVQLEASDGLTYRVGKACQATMCGEFVCDWFGVSASNVPTGTYILKAHLIGPDGVTRISSAPGPGSQYQIPSCDRRRYGFLFSLT